MSAVTEFTGPGYSNAPPITAPRFRVWRVPGKKSSHNDWTGCMIEPGGIERDLGFHGQRCDLLLIIQRQLLHHKPVGIDPLARTYKGRHNRIWFRAQALRRLEAAVLRRTHKPERKAHKLRVFWPAISAVKSPVPASTGVGFAS